MKTNRLFCLCGLLFFFLVCSASAENPEAPLEQALTPQSVLENASDADWRPVQPDNLMIMSIGEQTIYYELAPAFAPQHVANLRMLIAEEYFDGLAVIRSHDNYVAQWGDPQAGTDLAKSQGAAKSKLAGEFYRALQGLSFTAIESTDAYAKQVGFSDGFATGTDGTRAWLTHCYGALGAGRGMGADSGNGAELYVVTGHSPRHLDRNVTLLGRVLQGIEALSSLPRGTGPLGFYETEQEYVPIQSIRLAADLPAAQRPQFEVMRTDTETFRQYVKSRTYRSHEWFLDKVGKIEVCNVGVPVRKK